MTAAAPMPAVVLAGERPGGSALARAHGVAAGALVEVAGRPCIERVLAALRASASVAGGVLVGPDAATVAGSATLQAALAPGDFTWLAPASGPSASAQAGARHVGRYPLLLTTADHALLMPAIIDGFCARAVAHGADFVAGLVPHARVRAAWPQSRRTVLRFRDEPSCGANLYLVANARALDALGFWRTVEADRKRPWRIARRIGAGTLARYLCGRLDRATAFARLSRLAGATVGYVTLDDPRAAVDVDSGADRALAESILHAG